METYSQRNEDLLALKYFDYKKNGYFVEMGAMDGIESSNTYLMETKYDWNGICVEPQDFFMKNLLKIEDVIQIPIVF